MLIAEKQPFVHQRNCPHWNAEQTKVTINPSVSPIEGEDNVQLQRHNSLKVVRARKDTIVSEKIIKYHFHYNNA